MVQTSGAARKIESEEELLHLLIRPSSSSSSSSFGDGEKLRLVVVDTNVLLHNLDILEYAPDEKTSAAIPNLVIPQTALMECRNRSFSAYGRVMDLLRSSSSSSSSSNSKSSERCAIFFPDQHHTSTQPSDTYESINEENDARIRSVALHFGKALAGTGVKVILLTDDASCRNLAAEIYN